MKKNYRVIAGLMLSVLALSACGTEENSASSAEETAAETETGTIEPFESLQTKTLLEVDVDSLVTLGEYKGITVEVEKTKVTDEDVENAINNAFASAPYMKEVTDRAIEEGDTANIDFVGKYADTNEEFEGGAGQGYDLTIGSHSFIDGFEDGLIGVGAGETVDLALTFPEDYMAENLAGVDVIFTVTVNSIKLADEEPSDEWAESLGIDGVTDLESLRTKEREDLEADAEEEFIYNVQNMAIDQVIESSEVAELPQPLLNRYSKFIYDTISDYIQNYGYQISVEDYVTGMMQQAGVEQDPVDYMTELGTTQAERLVVMQAIANKEGLEVGEDELNDYIKNFYDM